MAHPAGARAYARAPAGSPCRRYPELRDLPSRGLVVTACSPGSTGSAMLSMAQRGVVRRCRATLPTSATRPRHRRPGLGYAATKMTASSDTERLLAGLSGDPNPWTTLEHLAATPP